MDRDRERERELEDQDNEKFMFDTLRIKFGNETLFKKARWIEQVYRKDRAGRDVEQLDLNDPVQVQEAIDILLPLVINLPRQRMYRREWIARDTNQRFIVGVDLTNDEEVQETLFDMETYMRRARQHFLRRCFSSRGFCGTRRSMLKKKKKHGSNNSNKKKVRRSKDRK